MNLRLAAVAAGIALLGSGSALVGRDVYMEVKAMLAERLITRAFEDHLLDGLPHRPWSWADMYPIARLEIDRIGLRRHVLAGASGTSMAFGVGHIDGTAPPNADGNSVLAGHRDTWCSFLRELQPGDRIRVTTVDADREWIVDRIEIIPATAAEVLDPWGDTRLTLVTCYPFNGLLRSPLRYVVTCVPSGGGGGVKDVLQ
jgi:sortase A